MERKLKDYKSKRNFNKTAEPSGEVLEPNSKILKYVVQYHIAKKTHYDFRLQWNGVLISWAVPKGPSFNPEDKRLAVKVEDHPIDYANFEGTIPKGEYGGGTVMIWDEGFWQPLKNFNEGLKNGALKILLSGKRLKGSWALVRLEEKTEEINTDKFKNSKHENNKILMQKNKNSDNKNKENSKNSNWLLIKEKDEFAKKSNGISKFKKSVKTNRGIEEINEDENLTLKKNPFQKTDVMLATLVTEIPNDSDWLFEIKYDGYRILAFVQDGSARLISRNNHDFTAKFKGVAKALIKLAKGRAMVLDGEMVVANDEGITDFQALQNSIKQSEEKLPTYMAFDLLALNGKDLRKLPLVERKHLLENLLINAPKNISFSAHAQGNGKQCFEVAKKMGLEGIVGKKPNSTYSGIRSETWIKIKCYHRQEFVVGGFTKTKKKILGISSLLLGFYENDNFIYAGRVGTGMTQVFREELENNLNTIKIQKTPFVFAPKPSLNEQLFWVKPVFVAEIQFAEFTKENQLRQASFKGFREDKNPKEVILENSKLIKSKVGSKVKSFKK